LFLQIHPDGTSGIFRAMNWRTGSLQFSPEGVVIRILLMVGFGMSVSRCPN
jgi:hypothetical protein